MPEYLGPYEWVVTEDQSPSLKLKLEGSEWMHSSGGAYAETQYIYGEAARLSLSRGLDRFLSVGFGLGYNEVLSFAESVKILGRPPKSLYSFESDPFLYESFLEWLGHRQKSSVPKEFGVYEAMMSCFETDYGIEVMKAVCGLMLEALKDGRWQHMGRLEEFSSWDQSPLFNCIYYDAFSSKSSPELWGEDHFSSFFEGAADEACLVATYACTGALKRSLVRAGFELSVRKGFYVKKESILAQRY